MTRVEQELRLRELRELLARIYSHVLPNQKVLQMVLREMAALEKLNK